MSVEADRRQRPAAPLVVSCLTAEQALLPLRLDKPCRTAEQALPHRLGVRLPHDHMG